MNPKNLEGKTLSEQKDMYEVELIADFEMKYGEIDNWTNEQIDEFDKKWNEIQKGFELPKLNEDEIEMIETFLLQKKLDNVTFKFCPCCGIPIDKNGNYNDKTSV